MLTSQPGAAVAPIIPYAVSCLEPRREGRINYTKLREFDGTCEASHAWRVVPLVKVPRSAVETDWTRRFPSEEPRTGEYLV